MDINKEMVADRVYEKLIQSTPRFPAIGWVSVDTYSLFDRTGVPDTFDFREILQELTDPRFEYRNSEARLLRFEPYALEVRNDPFLKVLTALHILHQKGVSEATIEQIAEESQYAVSTVKTWFRLRKDTSFFAKTESGLYFLTFDGDRTLWKRDSLHVTTLAEEAASLPFQRLEEIQMCIRIHTDRINKSAAALKLYESQLEKFSEEIKDKLNTLPRNN